MIRIGITLLDNLSHGMFAKDVTIGALQRNLCRRMSSWPSDESLAMAIIMGLDLRPVLEVDNDERMMRFWKMAKHVPRDVVIEPSPKFQVDGFRWAPRSLMDLKCDLMMDFQDRSATVTDEGLCGTFFLYRLHCLGPMPRVRPFTFFDTTTRCCLSVDKYDSNTEYTLMPGDFLCLTSRMSVPKPLIGALLRPVQHGEGTRPSFRYEALAVARLDSYENLQDPEVFLGKWRRIAAGWIGSFIMRADEDYKEIVIR